MTSYKDFSQAERIAIVETKVEQIMSDQKDIISKLDDLLTLRDKGMGVFWLAATLLGSGIIGSLTLLVSWIKGLH